MMCTSGIYAITSEIKDIETVLSTSAVKLDLKEYDNQDQSFSENGKIVMPGDKISLIPRVRNLGEDCYLRTKITYTISNTTYNPSDYINGNYKNWNRQGDYYYYESTFNKNQSLDIFEEITIPTNLPNNYQGKKVILKIVVEAIQSKHFDNDWNNVSIKESINKTFDIDENSSSTIIYENNAEKDILVDDHFFDNLDNLLPGDKKSENIKIINKNNKQTNYYLSIDYDKLSLKEKLLLKNIKLTITNKNNKVISSNLQNTKKLLLGTYKANGNDELTLTVSLPKNLDNNYSNLITKIKWKFSLQREDSIINPNTGDFKFCLSIIMFVISTIGMIIIILLLKKENRKINYLERKGEKI